MALVSPNPDSSSIQLFEPSSECLSSRIEAEITVKIGHADDSSSRLRHEYNVYTEIAGGTGIPPVHWYGKEGQYEVIIMDQ